MAKRVEPQTKELELALEQLCGVRKKQKLEVETKHLRLKGENIKQRTLVRVKGERDGKQQTDNNIGAEGARALSEALKTNTTLQSLDLSGEHKESAED